MLAIVAKFVPAARNLSRQIVPPVLATLIAALLIAGFNRAFSGHLVQPRMAALHDATGEAAQPVVYAANPHEAVMVTEVVPFTEPTAQRVFAKDDVREAGKEQSAIKLASAPAAAPAAARVATRKSDLPAEPRQAEPQLAAAPMVVPGPAGAAPAPVVTAPPVAVQPIAPIAQQPIVQQPIAPIAQQPIAAPMPPAAAPLPPVAQEPPAVIVAKPMVTVPDRPRQTYPAGQGYAGQPYPPAQPHPGQPYPGYDQRPPYQPQQADADQDVAPPREPRPLERFVEALRPSSIFNHIREFGDRVEAAGNEILPNIRQ
ncbi:MAG TPA: hypothetical protein VK438_02100 [Xanthobacteraceae bacterium]|nr:hypothetical protein [Xanthobacteraceae bacterium]